MKIEYDAEIDALSHSHMFALPHFPIVAYTQHRALDIEHRTLNIEPITHDLSSFSSKPPDNDRKKSKTALTPFFPRPGKADRWRCE